MMEKLMETVVRDEQESMSNQIYSTRDVDVLCPVCGAADICFFTMHHGFEGCGQHRLFWKERLTKAYLNSRWKNHPTSDRPRFAAGSLQGSTEDSQRELTITETGLCLDWPSASLSSSQAINHINLKEKN